MQGHVIISQLYNEQKRQSSLIFLDLFVVLKLHGQIRALTMASPRIVLISGCSSGIGLYTAVLLAKDPEKRFKVYATMRNLDKKKALEDEANETLGKTLIIKRMDVSIDDSVKSAVEEIIAQEGKIDDLSE